MATLTMNLDGLTCDMCVKHITADLSDLAGVERVEVVRDESRGVATVTGECLPSDQILTETVQDAGNYRVVSINR